MKKRKFSKADKIFEATGIKINRGEGTECLNFLESTILISKIKINHF